MNMNTLKKGQILDVQMESEPTFRGCILEVTDNDLAYVTNLETGNMVFCHAIEMSEPVIDDVFNLGIEL